MLLVWDYNLRITVVWIRASLKCVFNTALKIGSWTSTEANKNVDLIYFTRLLSLEEARLESCIRAPLYERMNWKSITVHTAESVRSSRILPMFTHQFCHGDELLQYHFEQGPSAHGQGCVRNREVVLLAPEEAGVILASPSILMIHSQSSVVRLTSPHQKTCPLMWMLLSQVWVELWMCMLSASVMSDSLQPHGL